MFGRRKGREKGRRNDGAAAVAAEAAALEEAAVDTDSEAGASGTVEFEPDEGPFDRSAVKNVAEFYAALGFNHIDLGAIALGIPPNAQLNAALSPDGSAEFHIVTQQSRVIPRAFAAPRTGGQWREWMAKFRTQLEQQNAEIRHEDGPWGRELVASQNGATFRLIGIEGPRWMLEARVISTNENADAAAEESRDIIARMIVNRGTAPRPAGEPLPLEVPDDLAASLQQARQQLAAQQQAQRQQAHHQAAQPAQGATPASPTGSGAAQPTGAATPNSQPNSAGLPQSNNSTASGTSRPRKRAAAIDRLREMDDE